MFDPKDIRREMEALFGDATGDRARTPNPQRAPSPTETPGERRTEPSAARRGRLLIAGLAVATIAIPLLAVVGTFAIPPWKNRAIVPPVAVVPVSHPSPAPKPSVSPPRAVSAYTVVARDGPAVASDVPRRWRRRSHGARPVRPEELAGEALERALAEDALATKRLNDGAMERLRPTLGYAQTVVDQPPLR